MGHHTEAPMHNAVSVLLTLFLVLVLVMAVLNAFTIPT